MFQLCHYTTWSNIGLVVAIILMIIVELLPLNKNTRKMFACVIYSLIVNMAAVGILGGYLISFATDLPPKRESVHVYFWQDAFPAFISFLLLLFVLQKSDEIWYTARKNLKMFFTIVLTLQLMYLLTPYNGNIFTSKVRNVYKQKNPEIFMICAETMITLTAIVSSGYLFFEKS